VDINALKEEFERISGIACEAKYLAAPHQPNALPPNKQGVYVHLAPKGCLKVGKAGPRSKARFNSHHYCANKTKSCLANSILDDRLPLKNLFDKPLHKEIDSISQLNISSWLKKNTSRMEFLIPATEDIHMLNFLEAFIQLKLKPVYEGKNA